MWSPVWIAAGLLAAATFATSLLASWNSAVDDAYITFNFARNISEGLGFVWFEGGPRVYGSTTLTYTLLLAFAGALGLPVPAAGLVLGALCWSGAYLLLFYLIRPVVGAYGLVALFLGAVYTREVTKSIGMETSLYLLLVLACLALYSRERPRGALLLCVALAFTRPDGALVGLLLVCHLAYTRGLLPTVRAAWPAALVAATGLGALWLYFGNPVPLSLRAKLGVENAGSFGPLEYVSLLAGWDAAVIGWAFLLVALAGLILLLRGPSGARLLTAWAFMYVTAMYLAGAPHFGWYYAPVIPVLFGGFSAGLSLTASYAARHRAVQAKAPVATAFGVLLVAICGYALYSYDRVGDVLAKTAGSANGIQHRMAQAVMTDMRREGVSGADVVTREVGYMGYLSARTDSRVHDLMGLTSLEAHRHSEQPMYLIRKYDPEYVVLTISGRNRPILNSETLEEDYERIFSKPRGGENRIRYVVFTRKDR